VKRSDILRFSVAQAFTPGMRKRSRYQSPINGAFETTGSFIPRRKRLGYGKVISNLAPLQSQWFASATRKRWQQLADFSHLNGLLAQIN
jgi:hypothetical protein